MPIYGLESDYYCAHAPIPVQVSPLRPEWNDMRVQVTDGFSLSYFGKLYQINGFYYVDLSPWVKMLMHELSDNRWYYKVGGVEDINDQVSNVNIYFLESNNNEMDPELETQFVNKNFVQCALYSQPYQEPANKQIKVWNGYPMSLHNMTTKQALYRLIDGTNIPALWGYEIEYDQQLCPGSYLKWLNEYGGYNYWFFRSGRQENFEGTNIFDVPRNIFNPDKSSNFDTVGFDGENRFTVSDKIPKKYWHLFNSLPTSPEVYILKDGWLQAYESGETVLKPEWWIKVRQSDVSLEFMKFKNSTAEVEFEFEYPKPYSQKRI